MALVFPQLGVKTGIQINKHSPLSDAGLQLASLDTFLFKGKLAIMSPVSHPIRWSFSFILGPLHCLIIFPTSREHRNIVQSCTIMSHEVDGHFQKKVQKDLLRQNILSSQLFVLVLIFLFSTYWPCPQPWLKFCNVPIQTLGDLT